MCEMAAAVLAFLVVVPTAWKRGPVLPIALAVTLLLAVNGYLFKVWSCGALPQVLALSVVPVLLLAGLSGLWKAPLGRPLCLLWMVGALAIVASPDRGSAFEGWLGLSVAVGAFALGSRLHSTGLSRCHMAVVVVAPSVLVMVMTLARAVALAGRVGLWGALQARLGDMGLNPNVLSCYLVLIVPVWLGIFPGTRGRSRRVGVVLVVVLSALLMLLTLSKGGWLGFAVAVGVFLALVLRTKWRYVPMVAMMLTAVGGSLLVARGTDRDSFGKRLLTWRAASHAIMHRPLIGAGLHNSEVHRAYLRPKDGERVTTSEEWDLLLGHSHNLLLQTAESVGLIGLILVVWLGIEGLRSARLSWLSVAGTERYVLAGLVGGLAGQIASAMFLVGYSTPTLLAVETMVVLSIICRAPERAKPKGGVVAIPLGLVLLVVTMAQSHRLAGAEAARHADLDRFLETQLAWARTNPLAATPRAEIGRLLLEDGRPAEARGWLEQAVARSKLYAPYRVSLARAYRAEGRWLDAMQQFEQALRLDPAYTQTGGGLAAKLELPRLHQDRGDDRKDPQVSGMGPRGRREARLATAEQLLESGRPEPAARLLSAILEEEQSPAVRFRAALLLGKARETQARPGAAIQAYRHASSIQEGPEPHEALGRLHLEAGRTDQAVRELELAVAAGAGSDAHSRLAQALETQGNLPRALWAARTAVRMSPQNARAKSVLGRLLFLDGATSRAIRELSEASRLDSASAKPLVLLAEVYRKQKDYGKALEALSNAITREPELPWAHKQRAFTLQEMGSHEEAVTAWREVLALDPHDTEPHYFSALALAATGDSVAMARELKIYLAADPHGRWAGEAAGRLARAG